MNNKIIVITPFYNPGEFLEQCVATLMTQNYDNFHVIFIDDASTDGAFDRLPKDDVRVTIIRNDVRKTALENIHNALINYCQPDDIAVFVDGDDWLPNKKVLSYVNDFYNQHDCWMMYGSSAWTDGRKCCSSEYTEIEFKNLRIAPFRVSHLRTFRVGLYHKIEEQSLGFLCMKDNKGDFYKSSYDTAICIPLLELAGYDKVKHNKSILYIYNRNNPISDDKVNQALQWQVHTEINAKTPLKKIDNYK